MCDIHTVSYTHWNQIRVVSRVARTKGGEAKPEILWNIFTKFFFENNISKKPLIVKRNKVHDYDTHLIIFQ